MNDLDIQHIRQTIKFVRDWTGDRVTPVGLDALTFHAEALLAEVERLRSGIETVLGLTISPGPRAESILRDLLGGER